MFARHVILQLKRGVVRDIPRLMDQEILPLLRRQKGFLDELVFIAPNEIEAVAISLWEEKEDAENFNRDVYPEIVKLLDEYAEGIPLVKDYDLQYATIPAFEKFAKPVAVPAV
jgi:hypothetical protein